MFVALAFSALIFSICSFVTLGWPPAVPPSECRLRTSLMATHAPEQIDQALETFARLGKELGVI